MFKVTEYLRAKYHYFLYMPSTHKGTPLADIRARQFGSLNSCIFQPVTPVNTAVPLYRPLFMRVSS